MAAKLQYCASWGKKYLIYWNICVFKVVKNRFMIRKFISKKFHSLNDSSTFSCDLKKYVGTVQKKFEYLLTTLTVMVELRIKQEDENMFIIINIIFYILNLLNE